MHDDKLLVYITHQIDQDINDGNLEGLWDMLDYIPRDVLLDYLGKSLANEALKSGVIKPEEMEDEI